MRQNDSNLWMSDLFFFAALLCFVWKKSYSFIQEVQFFNFSSPCWQHWESKIQCNNILIFFPFAFFLIVEVSFQPRIHTCIGLQLFANWKPLARCKLSQLIWQQTFLFCKQTCQSLQFFDRKPTDDLICVP